MKPRLLSVISISTLLLSACATTDDPSRGGFIGGVSGISTGAYDKRVREREDNLARMRALQHELEQESADLEAQKRQRARQLASEKRKLATLDRETAALERKLDALAREKGASDQRLPELQQRLDGLKRKLARQKRSIDDLEGSGSGADALEGSGRGGGDLRRQQLESQRAALQREYDELLNLTLMLAQ
jgi:chromosome segregation ATPase